MEFEKKSGGLGVGKAPNLDLNRGCKSSALIGHIARVNSSLLDRIPGDRGGSQQVAAEESDHILSEVNTHILAFSEELTPIRMIAGGSIVNTVQGLTTGFGFSRGMIGACRDDDHGRLFSHNMRFTGVDLSRLRMKKGPTGQANELKREKFRGIKWLVLRCAFQNLDQIRTAIRIAKQEGVSVSMDLASF